LIYALKKTFLRYL